MRMHVPMLRLRWGPAQRLASADPDQGLHHLGLRPSLPFPLVLLDLHLLSAEYLPKPDSALRSEPLAIGRRGYAWSR